MTVNSLAFLLFFFLTVPVYYLTRERFRWVTLLVVSLTAYYLMGTRNFVYVLVTTVLIYLAACKIEQIDQDWKEELAQKGYKGKEKKEKKNLVKQRKKRYAALVIVANLGILIALKYCDFLILNINRVLNLLHIENLQFLKWAAPLGMSYYTLQAIGYVLDVYKGKTKAEKNPFKMLLFVTFFPQMTQGPIGRFQDLAPQLFRGNSFSYHNFSYGCQRMLWGIFKKAVIADQIRPMTTQIFTNYSQMSGFTLVLGCIYFTLYIYADFSGYMDLVAGMAEIYGIHVMENFHMPFFSTSLSEYWRRWHISLSSWFRDYVFYPVSVSKAAVNFGKFGAKFCTPRIRKLFPAVMALFVVWFCTGAWHDASWRYILWGVANGVIIISSIILEPQFQWLKKKLHIPENAPWWKFFQIVRTFFLVSLLKVFPAPADTAGSLRIIKRILTQFHPQTSWEALFPGLEWYTVVYIALGLVLFLAVSLIQRKEQVRDLLARRPLVLRWAVYLLLLTCVLGMGMFDTGMAGGFEYAQY